MTSSTDRAPAEPQVRETGIYVYGIVHPMPDRLPPGLAGLDNGPVRLLVGNDRVAAVVSEVELDRPPGRRAELMAHSAVLDALAATGPVVPIQFGSLMEDEADVEDGLLAPNQERFTALLDELTGRQQFNLRATYHDGIALGEIILSDPEVRELSALTRELPEQDGHWEKVRLGELVAQALEGKREADTETVLGSVLPLIDAHSVKEGTGIDRVFDVALLVDAGRRAELEDRLEDLAEAVHERMRLSLVGPLAPYDFVGGDAWD